MSGLRVAPDHGGDRMTARAQLATTMTEKQLQATIREAAQLHDWSVYATFDSRRSPAGFPDLVLAHPQHGLLFAELKTATGRLRPEQQAWLDVLHAAGAAAFVWRPAHLDQVLLLLRDGIPDRGAGRWWGES